MSWLARFSPSLRKKIARMGITTNPASAAGADCSIFAAAPSTFARWRWRTILIWSACSSAQPRLFPRLLAISPEETRSVRVGIDARSWPALLRNSGKRPCERSTVKTIKERVSLQESHDRINQICEQDRKGKNDDDCARHVDDGKYNREEKDCQ